MDGGWTVLDHTFVVLEMASIVNHLPLKPTVIDLITCLSLFINFITPVTITTSNTRTQSSVVDASTLSSQAFTAPQTAVEAFNKAPATALGVSLGSSSSQGAAAVGVSLVQFTSNPLNAATASKTIGLQVSSYATSSSGNHRRLTAAAATVVSVALVNQGPVRYANGSHPVCETSAGAPFAPDPSCQVGRYTSMNTTCVCSFASNQVSSLIQFASMVVPAAPTYLPSASPNVIPNAGSPTALPMMSRWPSVTPTTRPTVCRTPDTPIYQPDIKRPCYSYPYLPHILSSGCPRRTYK